MPAYARYSARSTAPTTYTPRRWPARTRRWTPGSPRWWDFAHIMKTPGHADAALDALTETGMRAVFAHGTPMNARHGLVRGQHAAARPGHRADPRAPHPRRRRLVTLAMAARGPQHCGIAATAHDFRLARDLGP